MITGGEVVKNLVYYLRQRRFSNIQQEAIEKGQMNLALRCALDTITQQYCSARDSENRFRFISSFDFNSRIDQNAILKSVQLFKKGAPSFTRWATSLKAGSAASSPFSAQEKKAGVQLEATFFNTQIDFEGIISKAETDIIRTGTPEKRDEITFNTFQQVRGMLGGQLFRSRFARDPQCGPRTYLRSYGSATGTRFFCPRQTTNLGIPENCDQCMERLGLFSPADPSIGVPTLERLEGAINNLMQLVFVDVSIEVTGVKESNPLGVLVQSQLKNNFYHSPTQFLENAQDLLEYFESHPAFRDSYQKVHLENALLIVREVNAKLENMYKELPDFAALRTEWQNKVVESRAMRAKKAAAVVPPVAVAESFEEGEPAVNDEAGDDPINEPEDPVVIDPQPNPIEDPQEEAKVVVGEIRDLISRSSNTLHLVNMLQLIIHQFLQWEIDKGKQIDPLVAFQLQLGNTDVVQGFLQDFSNLDARVQHVKNARSITIDTLNMLSSLFEDDFVTSLKHLTAYQQAGFSEKGDDLKTLCMYMLSVPTLQKKALPYCYNQVLESTHYRASGLRVGFNDFAHKDWSDRVCVMYDFFRKSLFWEQYEKSDSRGAFKFNIATGLKNVPSPHVSYEDRDSFYSRAGYGSEEGREAMEKAKKAQARAQGGGKKILWGRVTLPSLKRSSSSENAIKSEVEGAPATSSPESKTEAKKKKWWSLRKRRK